MFFFDFGCLFPTMSVFLFYFVLTIGDRISAFVLFSDDNAAGYNFRVNTSSGWCSRGDMHSHMLGKPWYRLRPAVFTVKENQTFQCLDHLRGDGSLLFVTTSRRFGLNTLKQCLLQHEVEERVSSEDQAMKDCATFRDLALARERSLRQTQVEKWNLKPVNTKEFSC